MAHCACAMGPWQEEASETGRLGKDLAALGERAKREPGKTASAGLGRGGSRRPQGLRGMHHLLSSAVGVRTLHVPGAAGTPHCARVLGVQSDRAAPEWDTGP